MNNGISGAGDPAIADPPDQVQRQAARPFFGVYTKRAAAIMAVLGFIGVFAGNYQRYARAGFTVNWGALLFASTLNALIWVLIVFVIAALVILVKRAVRL